MTSCFLPQIKIFRSGDYSVFVSETANLYTGKEGKNEKGFHSSRRLDMDS